MRTMCETCRASEAWQDQIHRRTWELFTELKPNRHPWAKRMTMREIWDEVYRCDICDIPDCGKCLVERAAVSREDNLEFIDVESLAAGQTTVSRSLEKVYYERA